MKLLNIALKDLSRISRSPFGIGMALVVPLLITGLIYFAFGGISSGGGSLAPARVVVVNLDQPPAGSPFAAGPLLEQVLVGTQMASLMQVTTSPSEGAARLAVENKQADMAVVIPANFTQVALNGSSKASLLVYFDPVLQVQPKILEAILRDTLDDFSGTGIAIATLLEGWKQLGLPDGESQIPLVERLYVEWIRNSQAPEGSAIGSAFVLQKPAAPQTADSNPLLAQTMAGMMIFFVFYSGAVVAMNILQEDEQGTLARLFSTPTAKGQILLGKLVSVLLVMVIQTILLLLLSSLFFGIHWGSPLSLVLADLGTIAIAGGLGLFLMSLIRSSRQSGPILGGVLTLTAMLGGLFTVSLPSIPKAFQVANLFTPQGWALRAWKLSLSGASPVDLLVPFAVMLVSGLILFAVGLFRFKRRYA